MGSRMNFLVTSRTSWGMVAERRMTYSGREERGRSAFELKRKCRGEFEAPSSSREKVGREEVEMYLSLLGKKLEGIVDVLPESSSEHLIGLVETEHLDVVGLEGSSVDH